jgi:hypothetical protein
LYRRCGSFADQSFRQSVFELAVSGSDTPICLLKTYALLSQAWDIVPNPIRHSPLNFSQAGESVFIYNSASAVTCTRKEFPAAVPALPVQEKFTPVGVEFPVAVAVQAAAAVTS